MNHLSSAELKKLAKMSSLELTPEEEVEFASQLGDLLDYTDQIENLRFDQVSKRIDQRVFTDPSLESSYRTKGRLDLRMVRVAT